MNHVDRKNRWLLVPIFLIILACIAVDMAGTAHEDHAGLFSIPGFWSVFGLVGCLVLAGACKLAAHLFLKRPENYYDDVL